MVFFCLVYQPLYIINNFIIIKKNKKKPKPKPKSRWKNRIFILHVKCFPCFAVEIYQISVGSMGEAKNRVRADKYCFEYFIYVKHRETRGRRRRFTKPCLVKHEVLGEKYTLEQIKGLHYYRLAEELTLSNLDYAIKTPIPRLWRLPNGELIIY